LLAQVENRLKNPRKIKGLSQVNFLAYSEVLTNYSLNFEFFIHFRTVRFKWKTVFTSAMNLDFPFNCIPKANRIQRYKTCRVVNFVYSYSAISIKVVHEQSAGKSRIYERERLLGIANKLMNVVLRTRTVIE
jgi:hypothetical protein